MDPCETLKVISLILLYDVLSLVLSFLISRQEHKKRYDSLPTPQAFSFAIINDDSSHQMLRGDQSEKFLHGHLYQETYDIFQSRYKEMLSIIFFA